MMAVSATEPSARRIMSQWISLAVGAEVAADERPLGLDLAAACVVLAARSR